MPPAQPGEPSGITYRDQERAANGALESDLLRQLPRYEGHLSRELDRCLARLRAMQGRRNDSSIIEGRIVPRRSMVLQP